jgi:hypothetical protein
MVVSVTFPTRRVPFVGPTGNQMRVYPVMFEPPVFAGWAQ